MPSGGIVWTGTVGDLVEATADYERRVMAAVEAVANYFAPVLESHAKATAPWQDRTGNARQGLFSVVEVARDVVNLYLAHGMKYGLWLEVKYSGRYAVILPTLQAHYQAVGNMLRGIFGG